jgi:hypothetical protein
MSLPEVEYSIGQSFLMTLHLTPELQEQHGKETLIVEATYRGVWTNEAILEESVKIIAMTQGAGSHHVVEFNDEVWVNDLCGFHGKLNGWEETAINVSEELAVVDEPKEEEAELPDGPRPPTRHLLHGSKGWNVEGIRAARIKGDGPIEVCSITGEELFYIQGDGRHAALRTSAVCTGCERLVGERAMQMNGSDRSKYPVVYVGAHCIECWPNKKG